MDALRESKETNENHTFQHVLQFPEVQLVY